ncbi:Glucosidase II beta subunit-like protein [Teratosphaeria destructans]|uniref:Glucosidase 2 subunit beta n=1 Tax=Teratosphaeria destructans TaxID=418781 RepID=A0A9W7W693_9PEZI|nr:Glucosidase II beta subunit-like protein [Teratosphaeria destructans]
MKKGVIALLGLEYAASVYAAGSEGGRPRGVGPEFAKFYKDATTFTCISNPSLSFPAARVNDDYCDCPDGSDEPGTAACAHLSPLSPHTPADHPNTNGVNTTLALPGFYCKNKGHVPTYVPFTSVNDGVCDFDLCCDGSEEWEGVGGVKCADKCAEIGKEWKKQDEARQKSLNNAAKKRKELVAEAARLRQEVQDRLQSLGTEIEGSEIKVKQLEGALADVERKEKGKVVKSDGVAKAGKLSQLSGLAKNRINELREALIRVRGERDSSKSRLQELETILSTFKEEYNPNFNDEGVKRAVRAWEDYAARDKGPEPDAAHDRDLDAITKDDQENGINWDDYEGADESSDTDVLYAFENYLPASLRSWVDQQLRDLRIALIDAGILADTSPSGTESKALTTAKQALETAQKDLDQLRKTLTEHREDLARDFGPDDVFRALRDQCVATDSGEYTYELCFLSKTTQKPKKGGGHTNMGNFVRLETVVVDEDVSAEGKGLGSGERIAMKHENGQHCWNGPNRSTMVILACAERNEVWKILEEEKCVYRMEVGTPAVCEVVGRGGGKDEL